MTAPTITDLAELRFHGKRFAEHALDVSCVVELTMYRDLVLECAKALFHRKHPDRIRLPRGFEDGFRLQFDQIKDGSTIVPLQRVQLVGQPSLQFEDHSDEFDEAVALIDAAISAADADELLPPELPRNVIPLFREFGKTLTPVETLFIRGRGASREAPYTDHARQRLANWVDAIYEDEVDLVGEVRMANVGPGTFMLQCAQPDTQVQGKFSPEHEALVLDALREHRTARLRVRGSAEFVTADRSIKRFVRIDDVSLVVADVSPERSLLPPIWERLQAIGNAAPADTWKNVPRDLSERIDEVVYGRKAE